MKLVPSIVCIEPAVAMDHMLTKLHATPKYTLNDWAQTSLDKREYGKSVDEHSYSYETS